MLLSSDWKAVQFTNSNCKNQKDRKISKKPVLSHDFSGLFSIYEVLSHLSFTGYICFAIKQVFIYTTLINLRSLEEPGSLASFDSFPSLASCPIGFLDFLAKLRQAPSLWFWAQPSTNHFWFLLWHPQTNLQQLANWNGERLWKSEKSNCFNCSKHLQWVLLLKHCRCLILSSATRHDSLSTSHKSLT